MLPVQSSAMKAAMKVAMTMKGMKGMKAMKAMKVKRTSIIARGKHARALVFRGSRQKTQGGLTKDLLMRNKSGRVVSKARSVLSKKQWASSAMKKWCDAVRQARNELGITGFCAVNGKTAQGKAVYVKAKSIFLP